MPTRADDSVRSARSMHDLDYLARISGARSTSKAGDARRASRALASVAVGAHPESFRLEENGPRVFVAPS
jgi:hypothetical protein